MNGESLIVYRRSKSMPFFATTAVPRLAGPQAGHRRFSDKTLDKRDKMGRLEYLIRRFHDRRWPGDKLLPSPDTGSRLHLCFRRLRGRMTQTCDGLLHHDKPPSD